MKKTKMLGYFILTLFVLLFLSLWVSNNLIQICSYTIESPQIPKAFDGFKIVLISDLHSTSFGQNNSSLIKKIKKQNPDLLLMAGDMVNTMDTSFEVFLALGQDLGKKYPCYYIVGNHEQALDSEVLDMLLQKIEASGIKVLDNQALSLKREEEFINLYGLWFNLRYYKDVNNPNTKDFYFDEQSIKQVLGSAKEGYNILLTHNPVYFPTYANWGADLTLAGHMHGGLIRLPRLGGLLSPQREFFPQYSSGLYNIDNKILLINRGLGNGDLGLRFYNRPEISVIILKQGAEGSLSNFTE